MNAKKSLLVVIPTLGLFLGMSIALFSTSSLSVVQAQGGSTPANGSLPRTFSGHTDIVLSVAFSPDGKTILTGSYDHIAILWDVASGNRLRVFSGHTGPVQSVAFAPDGKTILTGSADHAAILWDVASGNQLRVFSGHIDAVQSVAFAPDGKTILTGSF